MFDVPKPLLEAIQQVLSEGKQVGEIYHYTTIPVIRDILNQEPQFEMYSRNGETFSATRFSSLNKLNHHFADCHVRISLDGDKISDKYKINPVAGLAGDDKNVFSLEHNPESRIKRNSNEAEEAIRPIPVNIKNYINHIHVLPYEPHEPIYKNEIAPKLDALGITHTYGKVYRNSNGDLKDNLKLRTRMNEETNQPETGWFGEEEQ